jgi:Ca-activated chloride channel family protein
MAPTSVLSDERHDWGLAGRRRQQHHEDVVKLGSPFLVLVLAVLPAMLWLMVRDERLRHLRLSHLVHLRLVPTLVAGASVQRRRLRARITLVALAAIAAAAMAPMWPSAPRLMPRRGLDLLFVVDVSRSMRARDVRPDRLERAKAEISAALPSLSEHRVGVVAFAGTAFVQCPLTTDTEAVQLFLRDLSPETVAQGGSALAAGLEVARNAFAAEDAAANVGTADVGRAGRVVVVVSDGEDHDLLEGGGEGLKPVGEELKKLGAVVVVIGVGSTLGEPIPVTNVGGEVTGYVKDGRGQTVLTRMSPEILTRAASDLGGAFVDGTAATDLGMNEVFAKVASLEKRELESRTVVDYADASWPLLAVGLFMMMLWLLVPERATVTGYQ